MTQALLYSIAPQHMLNILNGLKTIEVRKRDLPQWAKDKLARGEIVQGYGYCTMGKPYLINHPYHSYMLIDDKTFDNLNGLVVVKFEVSGTTRYVDCSGCTNTENGYECENDFMYLLSDDPILRKATCLEADEIEEYGNGKDLYAHHFTNIQPIEPMELSNFYSFGSQDHHDFITTSTMIQDDERKYYIKSYELRKAPQSFMTCWVKGE